MLLLHVSVVTSSHPQGAVIEQFMQHPSILEWHVMQLFSVTTSMLFKLQYSKVQ
jgi:hypothetical protein